MADKALANYASRKEVTEVQTRLMKMLPGGEKMKPNVALALAQIAVAYNLDPFTGDVWYIRGKGLMIGIRGLRKAADRQLRKEEQGTGVRAARWWGEEELLNDPTEFGAAEGDLVYRYRLYDSVSITNHSTLLGGYLVHGLDLAQAKEIVGPAPTVLGYGILTAQEMEKLDRSGQNKMPHHNRCIKRAQADALKKRFNIEFAVENQPSIQVMVGEDNGELEAEVGQDEEEDIIEADFTDPPEEEEPEAEEPKTEAEMKEGLGFDSQPPQQQLEALWKKAQGYRNQSEAIQPDKLRAFLRHIATIFERMNRTEASTKQRDLMVGVLSTMFPSKQERYSWTEHVFDVRSTNDLAGNQVQALMEWMQLEKDETGYVPSEFAVKEAKLSLREVMKAEGQTEMELDE